MKFKFTIYLWPPEPDELVVNITMRLPVDTTAVHAPRHVEIIIYVK